MTDYYEQRFQQRMAAGASVKGAAEAMATAYLDGKPKLRGKHKITSSERDAGFWSSPFLDELPADIWRADLEAQAAARAHLVQHGWQPDYIEVRTRTREGLRVPQGSEEQLVVLGAARLGATRLLDNVEF